MRPCESTNHTLISYDSKLDHILSVRLNRIVGVMGNCVDNMLCSVAKRKCNIIGATRLGTKLANGTYTGALGLLQSGKGHVYMKAEPDTLLNEYFIDRSLPLKTESIWASHIVPEEEDFSYFDLLNNFKFSLGIYLSFFATLISFGLICFGLFRLKMRSNDNYLNRNLLSKFVYISNYLTRCNKFSLKLILLFFSLFIWFVLQFSSNVIQTNKVVVDTSELVRDEDSLMKHDFVCFFQEDTAYNLALNSPKNSLLFKLLNEKTKFDNVKHRKESLIIKNDKCLMSSKQISNLDFFKLKKILINTEIAMAIFIFISQINVAKKIWALKKNIYEYSVVIYSNSQIEGPAKLMISKLKYEYIEYGITKNLYRCLFDGAESIFRKTIKFYGDINEYIDDYTAFSNLEFNNFRSLFIIYFSFLIFIFIVFFLFQIVPFYHSKFIRILINKILSLFNLLISIFLNALLLFK